MPDLRDSSLPKSRIAVEVQAIAQFVAKNQFRTRSDQEPMGGGEGTTLYFDQIWRL
jgi:hypothetical protein